MLKASKASWHRVGFDSDEREHSLSRPGWLWFPQLFRCLFWKILPYFVKLCHFMVNEDVIFKLPRLTCQWQWKGKQRPENTVALTLSESLIMPLVSYQCTFCSFISFSETRAYIFYSSFLLFGQMRRKVLQTKVQLIELNFLMLLTWTFHTSSSLTRFFTPLFFLSGGFLRFL